MAATFSLEIKTPEKLIFSGEVESLVVTHPSGSEGYLANHEPVLKEVSEGIVRFNLSSDISPEVSFNVSGGILNFLNNQAVLFLRSEPESVQVNP